MKLTYNESGRSMIEMLGVLAIMGVITAAAVGGIRLAMQSTKRTSVQDDVAQMTTGVRQLLGDYDDFSGINNATIFAALQISDKNPYGGKYELAANPSNKRQFVVSITGLPAGDCVYFLAKAWPDSAGFRASGGKQSGAAATPANCTDNSANNTIKIVYGE